MESAERGVPFRRRLHAVFETVHQKCEGVCKIVAHAEIFFGCVQRIVSVSPLSDNGRELPSPPKEIRLSRWPNDVILAFQASCGRALPTHIVRRRPQTIGGNDGSRRR